MSFRDLDREILDIGLNGQSPNHIPRDIALDYFLELRKFANEMIPVPEAGTESPEAVIMREQAVTLAQTQAELQRASMEAEELKAQLGNAEEVAADAQASAQQNMEHAGQAMEAANMATANAAAQADAKMRLSMRINEMRQQLSDIVSTDPVAEEGVGTGEVAGPGTPQTAAQQAQEAEMMAQEEEAAAASGQAAKPPTAKAAKEVSQAQRAQGEAVKQTAQAEKAVSKTSADSAFGTLENFLGGKKKKVAVATEKLAEESKAPNSLRSRWGKLYSKSYARKRVGGTAAGGAIGAGAIGGVAGKLISKSRVGAAIGGTVGMISGGASGGLFGNKKLRDERRQFATPILRAGLENLKRHHKGSVPVAAAFNTRTGQMRAMVKTKNGYKTFVADAPKTASDEAGGSDRIKEYLQRGAVADAALKNLVEAAFSTNKPVEPEGPGGFVDKAEKAVSGDLIPDMPNQDEPTGEKVATSRQCAENRVREALRESPRGQRMKSLASIVNTAGQKAGRAID